MTTLALQRPIEFGKLTISQLTFRDYAIAEDLLAFDERGQNRQAIALLASLTNMDEAVIKKLSVVDFRAADAIASRLLTPELDEKKD